MAGPLDRSTLAAQRCEPASSDTPALTPDEIKRLSSEVDANWHVDSDRLTREFRFATFAAAFALATRIALLAEAQGHHPTMELAWGWLRVAWTTDAIGAISMNDMIMAAKIDRLVERGLDIKER